MKVRSASRLSLSVAFLAAMSSAVSAAEGGAGFYLLGSKGAGAAITPPPGVFFQNDIYYYSGKIGGSKQLPTGGKLAAGVNGAALINLSSVIWVLPEEIAGGHLGIGATIPFGWKRTKADLVLSASRFGDVSGNVKDDIFTIGDPVVSGFLGWQKGNFHYQLGTMVNVPIGNYQEGEISNIAFHHWGADVFAATTWLDPNIGLDLSAAVGVTFNAENPVTNYKTGNEFHFEWAAVQHINEKFDIGLIGYYYQQLSGDSGEGAARPFKGRVASVGATIGWNFEVNKLPVSTRIKYFHEFAAENRVEGDAVFLTVSVPLSITK